LTGLIFDTKNPSPLQFVDESYWTTDRIKNELFLCLVKAPGKKYYKQAEQMMFRIPLTEQYPASDAEAVPFIIDFSDLSSKVQKEFIEYAKINNKRRITIFLKQVVIRLFENLDYNYAHMSVMRKMRVKVVN
jgi:hypothetical protein